jgi:hypothetical protein
VCHMAVAHKQQQHQRQQCAHRPEGCLQLQPAVVTATAAAAANTRYSACAHLAALPACVLTQRPPAQLQPAAFADVAVTAAKQSLSKCRAPGSTATIFADSASSSLASCCCCRCHRCYSAYCQSMYVKQSATWQHCQQFC